MFAHLLARSGPAMRRVARPRPIGAAGLGALLVLSMAAIPAPPAAADSGACLVGASATSLRPNSLEVMFAGCPYVVSAEAPPYIIDLVGPAYSRQLYRGDGATPDTTSGDVTWTIGGLPAGTYQVVSSGVVDFDADGSPVIGTGSLSIRVFGAQGTTPTPTPVPATPTPHPTTTPNATRTPQPTGTPQATVTPQAKPSATASPTRASSPVPVEARATAADAPHSTATAHAVATPPATSTSAPPSVAVTTAPAPAIAASTSSPGAPSSPALPSAGAPAMAIVAPTPPASLVAAVAPGAHGPSDQGTALPAGISTAARSSAVTGATLRLVLVLAGGLVALAVVLGAVRSRRRRVVR